MKEPYEIYVEMYGKIKSGGKIEKGDFGEDSETDSGGYKFEEYDKKRKLAVTLAVDDATRGNLSSVSEFEKEINRLQSSWFSACFQTR